MSNSFKMAVSKDLRARTGFLDINYIESEMPTIGQQHAHSSRSERYSQVTTKDILIGLQKEGFYPVEAAQQRVRLEDKKDFTKHIIWLSHLNEIEKQDSEQFRIGMLNSHDGSSSYRIMAGYLRQVCYNGLIVGDCISDISIRHSGQAVDHVIEGVYSIIEQAPILNKEVMEMKAVTLNDKAQELFAKSAALIRWEDSEHIPVEIKSLNRPRRLEDKANDLWSTFNRIQENLIRGGLRGRINQTGRRMAHRAVTGLDNNVRINKDLWNLAEAIVQINNQHG